VTIWIKGALIKCKIFNYLFRTDTVESFIVETKSELNHVGKWEDCPTANQQ